MNMLRFIGIVVMTTGCAALSFAQELEYDDMYFNAKDREKLQTQKMQVIASVRSKDRELDADYSSHVNPTDSYSAGNINPEYISRQNGQSGQSAEAEEDYFSGNYQYEQRSQYNNWSNNYNNQFNNSWYNSGWYSPGFSAWNSPFYGYSSWNNPYYGNAWGYDPFYSGMYSPYSYGAYPGTFSYYSGGSWGYGCGLSFAGGWGNPYWSSYNNFWSPMYGYGNRIIIIDNANSRSAIYEKRSSRSTYSGVAPVSPRRVSRDVTPTIDRSNSNYPGGRVSSHSNENRSSGVSSNTSRTREVQPTQQSSSRSDEYYNRSWKRGIQQEGSNNNSNNSNTFSYPGRGTNNNSYSAPSRSTWNDDGGSRGSSSYGGSRNSGSGSFSGGSNSSSGSHSGRSRGR